MSHFTRIKTVIKEAAMLRRSLGEVLNWPVVANGVVRGYRGDTVAADIVAVNPQRGYDIGYVRPKGAEAYEMVADFFGLTNLPCRKEDFAGIVARQYALNILKEESLALGFEMSEVSETEEGAFVLALSKW